MKLNKRNMAMYLLLLKLTYGCCSQFTVSYALYIEIERGVACGDSRYKFEVLYYPLVLVKRRRVDGDSNSLSFSSTKKSRSRI